MGLVALLGGLAARFLGATTLKWLAWKAAMLFFSTVIVPIIVNNIFHAMLQKAMNLFNAHMAELNLPSTGLAFVGLAAWLAIVLKIPESISIVLGAASYRVGLSFIPFFGKR